MFTVIINCRDKRYSEGSLCINNRTNSYLLPLSYISDYSHARLEYLSLMCVLYILLCLVCFPYCTSHSHGVIFGVWSANASVGNIIGAFLVRYSSGHVHHITLYVL